MNSLQQRVPGLRRHDARTSTIRQHYYPEGGWGCVVVAVACLVQVLAHGLHTGYGAVLLFVLQRFGEERLAAAGWVGAFSMAVSLAASPLTIAICRRKSTRLTAVLGGLVTALGCLFTSFASQFHQLFFSYCTVIGLGVGMTRDSSALMVGQYFKRRREFVEIFVVSGSGLGITIMSLFVNGTVGAVGWRLGLQAVTGAVFVTFLLGTCYRSASLYHPQRRAILHLKNQKRKVKDKKTANKITKPFFDLTTLKSRTVQILLLSTSLSAVGLNTPLIYMAHEAKRDGVDASSLLLLQTYLGLAWVLGCLAFGSVVVQHSTECRIGRQYLCQASALLCGVAILGCTAVRGYGGYVLFVWVYGLFCGGYSYSLKMFTYEKVRARNFASTWGFIQCSQAIPIALGVPIAGYINISAGDKAGFYFSSTFVVIGSLTISLIDIHRRRRRQRHARKHHKTKRECSEDCRKNERRSSLPEEDVPLPIGITLQPSFFLELLEGMPKPELTCISEEGIADMDIPDHILEELELYGDITTCNQVENYLMLSEYENNLIGHTADPAEKRRRRSMLSTVEDRPSLRDSWRFFLHRHRSITTIDEASV
ncbi:monocarboxylate transporter 2-like [Pollicipes pollicipes]|uniref:monocarboxylate transporter 2-like n=1 Tax=Pollicipes pollicipes TaxID=41117 RepID=UPI001884959E|nr:monocarboxylate transporter 2-like [Pollicipes pollicipes]